MRKTRFVPLGSSSSTAPSMRLCDQQGCELAGEFRAPKSPHQPREYIWFCLDHVREYNKSWDFYKGMSPEEIEASRISDITWNRPSWPVGGWRALIENARYCDGLDPFLKSVSRPPSIPQPIQKALNILELALPLTIETLKKQYKKLVKCYHPDLHSGNKLAEERLKAINEAYQVVKKHLSTP
ncbi:MAG: J domain-containing protein [Alphaproteobacteria bacterium]|nr:J domain-containing protein [Alphaproteobacteria bacterium]